MNVKIQFQVTVGHLNQQVLLLCLCVSMQCGVLAFLQQLMCMLHMYDWLKLHQADQADTFCCIVFTAVMASRITSEFKAEFTSVLMQTKLPANELFQLSMKVLAKHKLTYTTKAQCKYFLVHKANRATYQACLKTYLFALFKATI